jgi:hypothetical protein
VRVELSEPGLAEGCWVLVTVTAGRGCAGSASVVASLAIRPTLNAVSPIAPETTQVVSALDMRTGAPFLISTLVAAIQAVPACRD